MFAKSLFIIATSIAAVRACTNATPLTQSPILAPTNGNMPIIGQVFNIEWDTLYPGKGPTVTISLYNGCPDNCKEVTDVVAGIQNTGNANWTPPKTLKPGNDYGFLFINETPCETAWAYFTLYPEGTIGNATFSNTGGPASSAAGSAASSVASSATSAAATSPASSTLNSIAQITMTHTNTLFVYATTLSTVYRTVPANADGACGSNTSIAPSATSAVTA